MAPHPAGADRMAVGRRGSRQLLEFLPLTSAAVAREVLPALPQVVGESDNEVRLLLSVEAAHVGERTLLLR